VVKIKKLKLK